MSTDPISLASAELLAAGVTGRERLLVLEVLGALIDEAGPWGMVRPDPERLAATLHSDPDTVTRRIAALDKVGAIQPCGDRWQIVGASARPHDGPSVATAIAILADERRPSSSSRHARRLAPVTAAAALVAVVVGTLAVIGTTGQPPSSQELVAVDAPRSILGPRSTSSAVSGPTAEPGTTAAPDPAAAVTPPPSRSVNTLPGSSVATTAAAAGCTDVILAGGVTSVSRDLSANTVATGWFEGDDEEEMLLHTVVLAGHELVLPTAIPVAVDSVALWAVALPEAVAAELAEIEPEELVAAGRATSVSCLDA